METKYQNKPVKYQLDKMYTAEGNNEHLIVVQIDDPYSSFYRNVLPVTNNTKSNYAIGEIEIFQSFKKVINKEGLTALLIDENGKDKTALTSAEVVSIVKFIQIKNHLTNSQLEYLKSHSEQLFILISDLLGINIHSFMGIKLKKERCIKEVAVPAKKVEIFRESLTQYIATSLLRDNVIMISNGVNNQDYRIARALRIAKIKVTDNLLNNSFDLVADIDGHVKIDGKEVNRQGIDLGFQKKFKI